MTLCHRPAFWSWPANWNHQLVSPAFLALPIGTYYRFSPAFWLCQSEPDTGFHQHFGFANRNLSQVFTSILALPIRTYKGFHQHFSTANCTAAVQHGWQTAFKLMVLLRRAVVENFILHFLISVFKSFVSGPDSCEEQFRLMDFISPQEFQRGLTGFTLHKTTTAAVFFQLSSYDW